MITKDELKTILVDNLRSPRQYGLQLFLTELLERGNYGGGIERYRVKNTVTGAYVTTLEELIAALDAEQLRPRPMFNAPKLTGDRVHPAVVVVENLSVELLSYCEDDADFLQLSGSGTKKLYLYVNYVSDDDTVLPLKIYTVKLF